MFLFLCLSVCIWSKDQENYEYCINHAESPCRTPDGLNGTCVVLQQCRPLYRLIRSGSISPEQRQYLRDSQCGRDGTNILVCCPNTFTVDDLPSKWHCAARVSVRIVGGDAATPEEFPWYVKMDDIVEKINIRNYFLPWKYLLFYMNSSDLCFWKDRMSLLHYTKRKQTRKCHNSQNQDAKRTLTSQNHCFFFYAFL